MQNRTRNDAGGMATFGGVVKGVFAMAALWLSSMTGAQAAVTSCTPQPGFNNCLRITYSGGTQAFTVPGGVTSINVTMWGGGGGGSTPASRYSAGGGAGGHAVGNLTVTPGTNMAVTVGQAGVTASTATTIGRGGAGGSGSNANSTGSSGGGMSALWGGPREFVSAQMIAGGGGGGAFWTEVSNAGGVLGDVAGGGGGFNGGSGLTTGGQGGSQVAGGVRGTPDAGSVASTCIGGTDGSALQGGTGCSATGPSAAPTPSQYEGGGGGGGGWYGGGGGMAQCSSTPRPPAAMCSWNGPGGGGSGFLAGTVTGGRLTAGGNGSYTGVVSAPNPNATSSLYQSGVGNGGAPGSAAGTAAGNGMVVIQYNAPTLQLRKAWSVGSNTGDVARIAGTLGGTNYFGASNTSAFTAMAPTAGNSGTNPVGVTIGNVITLPAETLTIGTLANYNTALACTADGAAMASTLSGTNGQVPNTLTIALGDLGKAIVCTYTNTRKTATLQLAKFWSPVSVTGNVANIGAATGGTANTAAFSSRAPGANNSTTVTVAAGNTITLPAETMSSGALANYTTVLACTAGGGATANALSGTNGQNTNTLVIGAADEGKDIVCTYTNTPKTSTLQLTKVWGGNSITGHVASIGISSGGTSNTAAFTATAPTAATSGPAVTVTTGNMITLPAETLTKGTLANYNTVLACTADGGPTANALSGTDGQASNTLLVGAGDAGKAIVCTYANTPKTVTVQLRKAWSADSTSGDTASIGSTSGGSSNTARFTSAAPTAGNSGTAVSMVVGGTITLPAETMTTGLLASYSTVLACTADGGATTNPLSGTNGQVSNTLAIAAADAGKAIVCTYTNAKKAVTLQVHKAWGVNSETGNVVRIGATTGGANNTALFTATAPTAGNSGTAVVAAVGNTITFPAETMTRGTLANYTTVLSCTADGGATANALSGTDGQASNTLLIGATDAGKAIICTYSNNRLPTVQIRKQALGGTGTFAFSGTNGFGADGIQVSVSDSTVVGTIKTLTAANTQTVLTEVAASMPGGFAFSGATCTGLAGGATAAVDLVAGTVTLPAAGLTNGTAVVCTFTNTLAAIVSGRVFLDNGVGGGTANDGIVNGGEGPLAGVSVRLTNCGATVYASALTDASGGYSLNVPAGAATGSAMCVEETNPGTRVSTGASVGSAALPSGSAVAAAGGTYTYTRTGTPDRIAFSWNGTGHSNLNFGDVDNSAFATDGAKTGLPGSTVTYAHTFTAGTAGQVRFSVASETATPPITGWTTKVFADVGCTGSLQPGAAQLYPPSAAATPVVFAGKVCVIVQEFIPATAPLGSSNKATIRGDFTYTNASPSLSGSFTLDDLTTVSGVALELKKEVRNFTRSGTFGVNNQAKSGETLEYRITYTNNGDAPIRSMVVNDMTPGYTTFVSATMGTTPASLTACVKNTPANAPPAGAVACTTVQPAGGTGAIEWRFTGIVEPGGTGTVLFQVKVD